MTAPIALSCGDLGSYSRRIAAKAWVELRETCPFFYIGDVAHLPSDTQAKLISDPAEAISVSQTALPVLQLNFPAPNTPGQPTPANAPSMSAFLWIGAVHRAEAAPD